MNFEEMLKNVKAGRKMKRAGWADAYLFYDRCTSCISLKTRAGVKTQFFISNTDMFANDWTEHVDIRVTPMFASTYSVKCPKCGKVFVLGADWRTKTGDKVNCSCGCTMLLAPPVDEKKPEPEKTEKTGFAWPDFIQR